MIWGYIPYLRGFGQCLGFDMNYNEDAKSLMNRRGSEVSQEIEAALGLYRLRWGSLRVLLWLCFNVEA